MASKFLSKLLASFTEFRPTVSSRSRKHQAGLGLECLEARELMTVAPAAPVFTTTAVSSTQIDIRWNQVSGATGYYLDVWTNGSLKTYSFASNAIGYNSPASPGVAYSFDVEAYSSAGGNWASSVQNAVSLYNPTTSASYWAAPNAPLWGSGGPSPYDVKQGAEGDCWLIAGLAATAARQPQEIESMFRYYGSAVENGTSVQLYSVRFYTTTGAQVWITVDTELPWGGQYYDQVTNATGKQDLWVALAEKAYAEANGLGYVTSNHVGTDSYDALNAGSGSWSLHAITGYAANIGTNANLASYWNAGDPIVIGSDNNPGMGGIVGGHAYAIIGVSGPYFLVMNPWGVTSTNMAPGAPSDYGQLYLTQGQIEQNFAGVSEGSANDFTSSAVIASNVTTAATNVASTVFHGASLSTVDQAFATEAVSAHRMAAEWQAVADLSATYSSPAAQHVAAGLDEAFTNFSTPLNPALHDTW